MGEVANIPQLRFPEFSNEWEESKVGKVFKVSAGGDIKTENVSQIKTDGFPYPIYANAEKAKGLYGYSNLYKSEANVVTVAGRGVNIGIAHVRLEPFYPIVRLLVLNPIKDADVKFWENQLNQLNLFVESTGVPQLTAPQISSYKVKYPSKPEQQKIAAFLTAVDNKIEQLSKKQELLGEYKKGLMQQIFSQAIRFKADDGSEFPDWEEKKLGGMIDIVVDNRGKTPPVVKERNIPLIEVNAIGSKSIDYKKVSKFVTPETFKNWFRKYLNNGDILFSTVGQTAVCSIYFDSVKAAIAQNIVGLRFSSEDFKFMYYLLTERKNNHKFKRIEMGAVQPSVKVSQMIHIDFKIPSFPEQQKIANFLSSIDNKIEQVGKQLRESKQFKKALLQQMFV